MTTYLNDKASIEARATARAQAAREGSIAFDAGEFAWPADKVPGARMTPLSEAERAKLAQFRRRPFALDKRERALLLKLERREHAR